MADQRYLLFHLSRLDETNGFEEDKTVLTGCHLLIAGVGKGFMG
jgi:hypothetical protein